ncbi:hypothetical protein SERLA73DRAFT_186078 [Serpula lacrymans var. lacrymans S7.3]|uniref:Uncharacterized protein n=2 Tax=Serpula lacrymans var. lacrymans TaxID=341189 RepID=F8Q6X1_SERL3|nr:uncharacterized protein SERLADRAFT_474937 [Serpula lacrymans var. lacrymans S7.9]EGN96359.1 hypothetical protein SERLA73DRAFT_186078 [Serpula lacrymans var. lacrymans S7.3]EGO21897.1 hypothetical protein SERLADRAFT_474937 [Serpula lacrymans var. lacrymans S7.9]
MALWPSQARYSPLLPAGPTRSSRLSLNYGKLRCNAVVFWAFVAVVLVIGAFRAFTLPFSNIRGTLPTATPPDIFTEDGLVSGEGLYDSPSAESSHTPPPFDTPDEPPLASPVPVLQLADIGDDPSLDQLHEMVSQTKGFFSRDYSLGLGWNNVRYIIEAALVQAQILNRTLVIPSYVYARACEYEIAACADQASMVNRGDAIGWDEWRELPIEKQMAWKIPIDQMLNLTHLRHVHPVIRSSEFFRLRGLPENTETSSGWWDRTAYHRPGIPFGSDRETSSSLFVIENEWYDPRGMTRVDKLSDAMKTRGGWTDGNRSEPQSGEWQENTKTTIQLSLEAALPEDRIVMEWDEVRSVLQSSIKEESVHDSSGRPLDVNIDEDREIILQQNGWEVLYTFNGARGMDFVKYVVEPIRQTVPRESIRGFFDDFANVDADVVVLAGETHLYRKPGALRFASPEKRDAFARIVLHNVVPTDKVLDLARRLDSRLSELNGGRMWVGAHMRRGDFVSAGWAWGGSSAEVQFEHIKARLGQGREALRSIQSFEAYSVPGIEIDEARAHRSVPEDGDRFFVATDERDPQNLHNFSENGAIMFHELVTIEDRHEFGWPLMFTDIIGLVEQATLARASYFYGSAMSSFSGGVVNMRSVLGADRHTALMD